MAGENCLDTQLCPCLFLSPRTWTLRVFVMFALGKGEGGGERGWTIEGRDRWRLLLDGWIFHTELSRLQCDLERELWRQCPVYYRELQSTVQGGWDGKESACNTGDPGSIPGLGRSPGEGNSYPFQYSGLENSMDYTVHGVTKSQTRLRDFHFRYQVLLAKCPVKQKVFSIFFLRSSGVKKKNHETFRKDLIFGRSPNHFRGIPGGSAM